MKKVIVFTCFAVMSISALADVTAEMESFAKGNKASFDECTLPAVMTSITQDHGDMDQFRDHRDKTDACIQNAIEKSKPAFKSAISSINKKSPLIGMFKDYYATWITSINSLSSIQTENNHAFSIQKNEAERRFMEKWNRISIE